MSREKKRRVLDARLASNSDWYWTWSSITLTQICLWSGKEMQYAYELVFLSIPCLWPLFAFEQRTLFVSTTHVRVIYIVLFKSAMVVLSNWIIAPSSGSIFRVAFHVTNDKVSDLKQQASTLRSSSGLFFFLRGRGRSLYSLVAEFVYPRNRSSPWQNNSVSF